MHCKCVTVSKFTHNACFGCIISYCCWADHWMSTWRPFPGFTIFEYNYLKLLYFQLYFFILLLILNLFSTLALLRNTNYLLERYSDNGNALRFPPCDGSYHADHGFLAPVGATYVSIVVGFVTKFYIVSGFPKKRFGSL